VSLRDISTGPQRSAEITLHHFSAHISCIFLIFKGISYHAKKSSLFWRFVKRNRTFAAFTLVELLVVIAVIAILAALLLASLTGGKVEADSAVCKSNLHQLTLAMTMYAQDTGTYPYFFPPYEAWPGGWPAELQPYLKCPFPKDNVSYGQNGQNHNATYLGPPESVWACPSYNRVQGTFWLAEAQWSYSRGAYGYNTAGLDAVPGVVYNGSQSLGLGGRVASDGIPPPTRESQVVSPCDMIAIGDAFYRCESTGRTFLLGGSI